MYGVSDLFIGAWHLIKDPVFPPTSKELNDRLEAAVRYDQTLPALYALKKGAHPTARQVYDTAWKGNTRLLKALVQNGGSINDLQPCYDFIVDDDFAEKCSPLFPAIKNGHTKTVKALLENGADVYRAILTQTSGAGTGENQTTSPLPLQYAEKHNLTDIVALLKDHIAQNPPPPAPVVQPAPSAVQTPATPDFNKSTAPETTAAPVVETGQKVTVKPIRLKNTA